MPSAASSLDFLSTVTSATIVLSLAAALWFGRPLDGPAPPAPPLALPAAAKKKPMPVPPGLTNSGNGCFINALLQALASSSVSLDYFDAASALCLRDVVSGSQNRHRYCVFVHDVLAQLKPRVEGGCLNLAVEHPLRSLSARFLGSSQQDAEELLLALLEQVSKEVSLARTALAPAKGIPEALSAPSQADWWRESLSPLKPGALAHRSNALAAHRALYSCTSLPNNRILSSNLQSPFEGSLVSQLTCQRCGRQSPLSCSAFTVLTLAISKPSLLECLVDMCASETVEDVECPRCALRGHRSRQAALKRVMFSRFPKLFCIRVQRTKYDRARRVAYKDETRLDCPLTVDLSDLSFSNVLAVEDSVVSEWFEVLNGRLPSTLDPPSFMQTPSKRSPGVSARVTRGGGISPIVTSEQPQTHLFNLVAIIEHLGSASGGHFVCHVKLDDVYWARCSDEEVRVCDVQALARANVFMYWYQCA